MSRPRPQPHPVDPRPKTPRTPPPTRKPSTKPPAKPANDHRAIGAIGAYESWSRTTDRAARTAPARAAADERFYAATDPALPEQVRRQQAAAARAAFYRRIQRASVLKRRKQSAA